MIIDNQNKKLILSINEYYYKDVINYIYKNFPYSINIFDNFLVYSDKQPTDLLYSWRLISFSNDQQFVSKKMEKCWYDSFFELKVKNKSLNNE